VVEKAARVHAKQKPSLDVPEANRPEANRPEANRPEANRLEEKDALADVLEK